MVIRKIIGALLVSTSAAALPVQAQQFCSTSGTVTTLNFNVKPSLVAHSDAIMETTFGDAGLSGGDPDERLFSFKRTIGSILEFANRGRTLRPRAKPWSRRCSTCSALPTASPSIRTPAS